MILSIPTIISMLCGSSCIYFSCETLVAYSVGSIVVLQVIWLGHMAVWKRWQRHECKH